MQTPILSEYANTDVQIEQFTSQGLCLNQAESYLRSSPEFFHKRLLASGSGDIFELGQVFRWGENTPLHNPEFTLLEWYRVDFELMDLIEEVLELIGFLNQQFKQLTLKTEVISYQALFLRHVQIDPFQVELSALRQICEQHGYAGSDLNRIEALDFLLSIVIQPKLAPEFKAESAGSEFVKTAQVVVVYDFPIEMAALAQAHPLYADRCLRFELLFNGVELTNGYQELTDAQEQVLRFEADNQLRAVSGKRQLPIDVRLIDALQSGLPNCSGVAVGVERLMMCLSGDSEDVNIHQVMGFGSHNS